LYYCNKPEAHSLLQPLLQCFLIMPDTQQPQQPQPEQQPQLAQHNRKHQHNHKHQRNQQQNPSGERAERGNERGTHQSKAQAHTQAQPSQKPQPSAQVDNQDKHKHKHKHSHPHHQHDSDQRSERAGERAPQDQKQRHERHHRPHQDRHRQDHRSNAQQQGQQQTPQQSQQQGNDQKERHERPQRHNTQRESKPNDERGERTERHGERKREPRGEAKGEARNQAHHADQQPEQSQRSNYNAEYQSYRKNAASERPEHGTVAKGRVYEQPSQPSAQPTHSPTQPRRASFRNDLPFGNEYGVVGVEDDEPVPSQTKEEWNFPPAEPVGAPPIQAELPVLYAGARGAAIRILSRVERSDTYLDKALEHELAEQDLSALDRALLTELVHGVLRWQSKLDWVLTGFYHGEFVKCITPVKNAMRIALYQMMFLTKIPPFAAVNESVEIIKRLKGVRSANLVNAVLRNILHNIRNIRYPQREEDPTRYFAIMYAHPSWMVKRWITRFGADNTEQFLKINNDRPKITLRINATQGDVETLRKELLTFLDMQDIKHWEVELPDTMLKERLVQVGSLSAVREWAAYQKGWFSVQDPSAALVCRLANPQSGQTVIDLCSAPGGKATFCAELMDNTGNILAVDKYSGKLEIVKTNAERLELKNIHVYAADARLFKPKDKSKQEKQDQQERPDKRDKFSYKQHDKEHDKQEREAQATLAPFVGGADIVLVDAPCSGLGTLAKKPDIRWKLELDHLRALVRTQREILANAARLVKAGGVLVYSTCTTEPEENMQNVEWFLQEFPEFRLDRAEQYLDEHLCQDGALQTFPHVHHIDGAFAVRLVKSA
jgi:16S rRNA (cytosine967-C5)-methyltransferase